MTFPVVSADSDHRLLSGNPSGCAEVSQLYECLWEGCSYGKEKSKLPVCAGFQPEPELFWVSARSCAPPL